MKPTLTPEQWGEAWRLYQAAAELGEEERARFLESSTTDPLVIREVRGLLGGSVVSGGAAFEPVERAGTGVSHYRVGERIGRGGMGEVYEAVDLELDRRVAIKFLPERMLGEARAVARFLAEARAASALNHPNLVTIHEFVRQDGVLAIVMERIPGLTLRRVLEESGPRRRAEFLTEARQLAEALEAAHANGIVHRDLKPENMMVRGDGYVKILDFGLAVLAEQVAAVGGGGSGLSTLAGTPRYMSPEQQRGETLTPASDIYSLGLVFVEMLTGSADPKAVARVAARAGRPVARLLGRMLDVKPGARPAAGEVARELARAGSRRGWRVTAAVAAAVAAALAGVWYGTRGAGDLVAPGDLAVLPLTAFPGEEYGASFSPDGQELAFTWSGERSENTDIWVMNVKSRASRRLTANPADDEYPLWSPDGKTIAFGRLTGPGRRKDVVVIPAQGGRERVVGEAWGTDGIGDWSPDSEWLVVRGRVQLTLIAVRTGESRELLGMQRDEVYLTPAFSPDGRRIAFARNKLGIAELAILELNREGKATGPPVALRLSGYRAEVCTYPRWTRDGKGLVFGFNRGGARRLWMARVPEDPREEATPRMVAVGDGVDAPALSAVARRLVFARRERDSDLWHVPVGGKGESRKVLGSTRMERVASVARDGRLAFESDRSGFPEIWVSDGDGGGARAITQIGGPDTGSPRWSPDGRRIAFDSRKDGQAEIYVVEVRGPGEPLAEPQRLTSGGRNVVPGWSPDGAWIYFQSSRADFDRVWRVAAGGGEAQRISPGGGGIAVVSEDGRWVYYERLGDVWRCPAGGGPEELVVRNVVGRTLNSVGGALWFVRNVGGLGMVLERNPATSVERVRAQLGWRGNPGMAMAGDGKYAVVTRAEDRADLMLVENFAP